MTADQKAPLQYLDELCESGEVDPISEEVLAIRAAIASYEMLTARVEELSKSQQYTCEAHRNEVKKGGACVWCQFEALKEKAALVDCCKDTVDTVTKSHEALRTLYETLKAENARLKLIEAGARDTEALLAVIQAENEQYGEMVAELRDRVGEYQRGVLTLESKLKEAEEDRDLWRANACGELQSQLAVLQTENEALKADQQNAWTHYAACANTPLMRDVMRERDSAQSQLAAAQAVVEKERATAERLRSYQRHHHEVMDSVWPLVRLGLFILDQYRDELDDVDGGEIQDKAVEFGVLTGRTMTEPCGDHCRCAEWGDFPLTCYFDSPATEKARAILNMDAPATEEDRLLAEAAADTSPMATEEEKRALREELLGPDAPATEEK